MAEKINITNYHEKKRFYAKVTNVWSSSSPAEDVVYLTKYENEDFPFPEDQPFYIRKPSQNMVTILTAAMLSQKKVEIIAEKGDVCDVIGYST
jgi:hypothetical protein